jgi:hypothetical protein
MLDLQAHDLADPQAGAVGKAQQKANLEVGRHCQQTLGLVLAHYQRYLLRLPDVIEFGEEIEPSQCDAEQEPQSRHHTIAGADAQPALSQV